MSIHPPRDMSRRRVLSGGLATVGATLILPHVSLATTTGESIRALQYDGDALVVASKRKLWRVPAPSDIQHVSLERSITAITSHPETPGTLFAAVDPVGLMRSRDGGAHGQTPARACRQPASPRSPRPRLSRICSMPPLRMTGFGAAKTRAKAGNSSWTGLISMGPNARC